MLYSFFRMTLRNRNFMCRCFGTLCSVFIAYEDGTECSETSAHAIQAQGNHPKERTQQGANLLCIA